MKIKNRNTNFKTRFLRNSCFLAAGVLGVSGVAAGILSGMSHQDAFATNQIVNPGLSNIGENEIQMLSSKIKLTDDTSVLSITTTGQIKKMKSKCYSTEEMRNGTYDSERDSQVSYWTATKHYCEAMNIVYDFGNSLATGNHDVDGSFTLTWKNAAHDADGHAYNVRMHVDNIKIANAKNLTRPVSIMVGGEHAVYAAVQEKAAVDLDDTNDYQLNDYDIGASYDVEISVLEPSTNAVVNGKKTVYQMLDLDQPDYVTNSDSPTAPTIYTTGDNDPAPFAEGITLISGIEPNVYVGANSLLKVSNTHYGSSTRFTATAPTNTDEQERSSIAFRGDVSGFKYRWYGSNCVTTFGWIDSKKVVTSTSGTYKDNGRITPTDNEVLWKEDKSISAVPNPGYYVSKLTVDGREVTFTPDSTGRVTYVFNDVVADHTIDAQFAPYQYKVTVHHYRVGTTDPVAPDVVEGNHVTGSSYTSTPANVESEGYVLVTRPQSETVTFVDQDIELIYYYGQKGNIIVEYCDVDTNKCELAPSVTDEGIEGGTSNICVEKAFDDYSFVRRDGDNCVYSKDTTNVKYWYKKNAKSTIVVEYCDVDTEKCDLAPAVTDEGADGEESKVCVEKSFDGYSFVRRDGDNCVYDKDTTNIKYWYKKNQKGTVVVEYCDIATRKCDIAPSVTDEGPDGEESKVCVAKAISGYSFVNREGDACVYDKDTANVKYWYKKAQNPNTADINFGGYAAASLGLTATLVGSLFFVFKKRR